MGDIQQDIFLKNSGAPGEPTGLVSRCHCNTSARRLSEFTQDIRFAGSSGHRSSVDRHAGIA
jgi:hypothetical protein